MLHDERPENFKGDNQTVVIGIFFDNERRILTLQSAEKSLYEFVKTEAVGGESIYDALTRAAFDKAKIILDPFTPPSFRTWYVEQEDKSFILHLTWIHFSPRPNVEIDKKNYSDFRWLLLNDVLSNHLDEDTHKCIQQTKKNAMSVH